MAYINGKQILNLSAAINGVASVNGKTGNVVLTAADIESDNGTVEESLQNILSRLDGGVRTAFNTADVDLNTYTDAGWWYTGMDTTVTNAPIEDIEDFELIVMKTQGAAMQFFFFPGQSLIYCRNDPYGTGSWGSWEKIITEQFVDSALSTTSTNPVQNKVLTDKFENIKELKTPKESVTYNSYTAPYCQSGIVTDSLTELNKYRTTIGTATVSGEWNNIISVRHRNGGIAGDGQSYGMYLRAPMTYEHNLIWRQQFGASWKAEKTLLDSSNFTNYIPYETGTCTLTGTQSGEEVTITNATYSVVGNMVTVNFCITPNCAGNIRVAGLPYAATKNQSGYASESSAYGIAANDTSLTVSSTSGTTEYCTVTYLK